MIRLLQRTRAVRGRVGRARQCRAFSGDNGEKLKFLVLDGYSVAGRQNLAENNVALAGELYAKMLDRHSPVPTSSDIVFPADDDFKMPDISQYHGVAWTGSSLTIFSGEEIVDKQIDVCGELFELGIPQFGSCWALQIAVTAAGGVCALNPNGREMGLARKIRLTSRGESHPMFEGKPSVFDAWTSHNDEVTHMPPNSLILAGNQHSHIQAACVQHKKGNFWAVQYHPEYDLNDLSRLTECRKEKLTEMGFFESENEADNYVARMDQLYKNPTRKDLRWELAIDDDVLDENIRCIEVKNWIAKEAMPYMRLQNN
mmetsp:Transcript_14982/g.26950  ORF Transcript_14982/g.26950 Transcript_14982/m.26950 type:complete len:314 (+) Transcript_14982:3-944(+)